MLCGPHQKGADPGRGDPSALGAGEEGRCLDPVRDPAPTLFSGPRDNKKGVFSLEVFLLRSAPSWPELDSTGIDGSLAVLLVEKYNEPGLVCDLVEAWG